MGEQQTRSELRRDEKHPEVLYEADRALRRAPGLARDVLRSHSRDAMLFASVSVLILAVVALICLAIADALSPTIAALGVTAAVVAAALFRLRLAQLKARHELRASRLSHSWRDDDPSYVRFAALRNMRSQRFDSLLYHLKVAAITLPIACLLALLLYRLL